VTAAWQPLESGATPAAAASARATVDVKPLSHRCLMIGGFARVRAPCVTMNHNAFALSRAAHKTVLVVVRDAAVRELIAVNLSFAGFYPIHAESRAAGQALIAQVLPDAVVLDLDCPEAGGLLLAGDIRAFGKGRHIPILMLTGTPNESCGSRGTVCGADDCVAKPFAPNELVMRVARLLGRASTKQVPGHLVVGPLELDIAEHAVRVRGVAGPQRLSIPGAEFRLLQHFMSAPDRVHSREHLLAKVWRHQGSLDLRTVDQNIRRLRSHLAAVGLEDLVETVRGVGYRLSPQRLQDRFAS
jgi:two-component system phosphate regulon response regulator PhoB